MTATVRIRAATAMDLASVDALLAGLVEHHGEAGAYTSDPCALLEYGFGERPVFHTLLCEQAGRAIGLCIFFPEFSTWRCQPGIYVQDLYVISTARGHGLGNRLLSEAMRTAKVQWGAAYLRLAVHLSNEDALAFYRRLGFKQDLENRVMTLEGPAFEKTVLTNE